MTTRATDTFTRADSGTLGANWTTLSGFNPLTLVSNTCQPANDATHAVEAYTGAGAVALDQWAQATVNDKKYPGLTLRSDTTSTFYVLFSGGDHWTIYKCVAGSFTLLDAVFQVTSAGDTAYFEVQGTALVTKRNGSTVNSITDAAIDGSVVGGPYPGIDMYYDDGPSQDDFSMGDFSAGGIALPVLTRQYRARWS
jgi:hypothetical protein